MRAAEYGQEAADHARTCICSSARTVAS
jgi:hypothetical protein